MVAKARRMPQTVTDALHAEIECIPEDRRALLLKFVHSDREGIEAKIEDIEEKHPENPHPLESRTYGDAAAYDDRTEEGRQADRWF
jgi:hypothetical protein